MAPRALPWPSCCPSASNQWRLLEIRLSQRFPSGAHELLIFLQGWCSRDTHHRVITVGRNDGPGVPGEALRVAACLHGTDTPAELLPEHDDPTVRGAQVLQAVDGDG